MSSWTPHLHTAIKDLDTGGYATFIGQELPQLQLLDSVVGLIFRSKYNEIRQSKAPLRFMHRDGETLYIGEYGLISDRLKDHPYCIDGGATGRPIKYFLGFSAPAGTKIPTLADMESKNEWFQNQLDKLVRGVNELNLDDKQRTKLEAIAEPLVFDGAGEHGPSLWDAAVSHINSGKPLDELILPDIEEIRPGIGDLVPGTITELGSQKKNRARNSPPGPTDTASVNSYQYSGRITLR